MHSKQKGNIGSSAVVHKLNKLGFNVFHELGDFSKIDLIAEKDNKLIKIQVKYVSLKSGYVTLPLRKSGPNGYSYKYTPQDIDFFALFCPQLDKVWFIPSTLACQNNRAFNLRIDLPKNQQNVSVHLASDYENLK